MKFFLIIGLIFISYLAIGQCSFGSPSLVGYDGVIRANGTLTTIADTISVCSGDELFLEVAITTTFTLQGWYIDGNYINNTTSITESLVNNTASDITVFYYLIYYFNSTCLIDTLKVVVHPKPAINVVDKSCNNAIKLLISSSNIISTIDTVNSSGVISQNGQTISQLVSFQQEGTYNLFLTDINNCNSDTIPIVIKNPTPLSGPDTIISQNDNCTQGTGAILIQGITGGTKPYSFINTNTNSPYGIHQLNDSVIANLVGDSNYVINLLDANGCSLTISPNGEYISRGSASPPDLPIYQNVYSVCYGDSLLLVDQEYENMGLKHYYYFSGLPFITSNSGSMVLNSTLANEEDVVQVSVEGAYGEPNAGCFSETLVTIKLEHVICQDSLTLEHTINAFKPNGNIENATYKIDLKYVTDETVTDVKVKIYNKWGDIIKEFENYDNNSSVWQGDNMSGDSMPEGTYVYTIEVLSKNFSTSGWVYLDK